jgi:hypothetical protein
LYLFCEDSSSNVQPGVYGKSVGNFSTARAGLLNPASGAMDLAIHREQARPLHACPTVLRYTLNLARVYTASGSSARSTPQRVCRSGRNPDRAVAAFAVAFGAGRQHAAISIEIVGEIQIGTMRLMAAQTGHGGIE